MNGITSLNTVLLYLGAAILFIWGVAHILPTRNVVAGFGPTEPRATAPFHPPSVVLKKDAPCGPCLYRDCPFDHRCMRAITAEEALAASLAFLR